MSLGDHLEELRKRLFRGVVAVVVVFFAAYAFRVDLRGFMELPLKQAVGHLNEDLVELRNDELAEDPSIPRGLYFRTLEDGSEVLVEPVRSRPQVTGPFENFLVDLKVSVYAALFVGGPYLLWQLWGFIAAGLYPKERRLVLSYFPSSILLFVVGVMFAFLMMVPWGIYFLNGGSSLLTGRPDFKANEYLSFLSSLCFGLGIVFQVPIVMTACARVGLVEVKTLAKMRAHFLFGAFVIAAVFTPPDPYTQVMMAGPMVLLYEVGIMTSRLAVKRRPQATPVAGQPTS